MLKLIVVGDCLDEVLGAFAAYQPECQPVAEEFEEVLAERLRAAMHRRADLLAFVDTRSTPSRVCCRTNHTRRCGRCGRTFRSIWPCWRRLWNTTPLWSCGLRLPPNWLRRVPCANRCGIASPG